MRIKGFLKITRRVQQVVSRSTQNDKDFGVQVKSVREKTGKSRREVAEKLGISQQQLEKYESALNRISAGRLVDIAKTLDAGILDVIPVKFLELEKVDNLGLFLWKKLSSENKKTIINVMREMKN